MNEEARVDLDFAQSNFIPTKDFSFLTTSIMPLIHLKDGLARGVGTCFAITKDGLCLTARHVIEEALPGPLRDHRPNTENDGWLYALYASDQPHDDFPDRTLGGLIPVWQTYINDSLDIAAVQLEVMRNKLTNEILPMPVSKIGLGLPEVGQQCIAFGYHSMEWSGVDPNLKVSQRFYCSRGLIEEIHLPRRDAVIAPFPCFRTSARYDGGMSGGPVIGLDGLVRGVVCSSIDGLNSEEGYISYVSLIGPAALLHAARVNELGEIETYFLGDFINRGLVPADCKGVTLESLDRELRLHIGGGVINNFKP